jgi:hypothetical protein
MRDIIEWRFVMELQQKDGIDPICPHCDSRLKTMLFKELRGFLGRRYVYFCPTCQKILGVSHRKGFWMG